MKTDYHKILKDNCPILFIENVSFLKKFCKTKKAFCILLFIAIALFLYGIFYMIAKDSKNVNKILLARESKLNSEILKVNTQNEILTAETILLKNEIKSLSKKIE